MLSSGAAEKKGAAGIKVVGGRHAPLARCLIVYRVFAKNQVQKQKKRKNIPKE